VNVEALRKKIPELLTGLGEDPAGLALGDDAWVVHRGTVTGYVAILGATEAEADPFLHVKFRVVKLPQRGREALLRTLLSLNHDLGNYAAFSVDENDCVWLGAGRFCEDVEEPELLELITQTARLADRYDDDLIETFGQEVSLT
jgi:hypothetical protein